MGATSEWRAATLMHGEDIEATGALPLFNEGREGGPLPGGARPSFPWPQRTSALRKSARRFGRCGAGRTNTWRTDRDLPDERTGAATT